MRHLSRTLLTVTTLAGLAVFASGCEREVTHSEKTEIKDDGTIKSKEKTVSEGPGNRTTVTEESSTKKPD